MFITPKPVELVQRILELSTDKDSLILDSFAGSGTTGHAVLSQNMLDNGNRRFILMEFERSVAENVTKLRLEKAIKGYRYKTPKGKTVNVDGLGKGYNYCILGTSLFDDTGKIQEEVGFGDLATHVYFSETGEPLPKRSSGKTPLLGIHNGTAIYLLYNGILKDKSPNGGNALTRSVLEKLSPHDGPKVIFGVSCRLGRAHLKRKKITFRQIPYELKVG